MTHKILQKFRQKKIILPAILSVITIVSLLTAIMSCVMAVSNISEQNSESDSVLVSTMISNSIENKLMKPITVSETMSQDKDIRSLLANSSGAKSEISEKQIVGYLQSIRNGMGYDMAYIIDSDSLAYYTWQGLTHYISDERESDKWYQEFVDMNTHYDLDVDVDDANKWALSVFVNTEMVDKTGNLIGVCGVAVRMTELQEMIKKYENEYNICITLADSQGLIQIASDATKIENSYTDCSRFNEAFNAKDGIVYQKEKTVSKIITYMPDLDWYLVVEDYNPNKIDVQKIVVPSILSFCAGIVLIIIATVLETSHEMKVNKDLFQKTRMSYVDELTDLFNRRAYANDIESYQNASDYEELTIVVIDINGLKQVNDNLGHKAGDELIKGASTCIRRAFRNLGLVYRTGGDEFVALLKGDEQRIKQAIIQLDKNASEWHGKYVNELHLAKGAVFCKYYLNESFATLQDLADKRMYDDKNMYYENSENDRRRR